MSTATRTPAPCGTPAAHVRHRRRGEPIDDACHEANAAYQNMCRRARRIAGREARREQETAQALRDALHDREPRRVRMPGGYIALGALAGTATGHGFLPDGHTGTSCLLCFGWSNDYRHTHRLWLRR